MVSRIIQIVGLISVAMLDRSLIVEAAKKRGNDDFMVEHRSAGELSVIRLPPDIVIPLPFVYPEYIDPREQKPLAVKPDLQTKEESLGTAILENVRNAMFASSSQEPEVNNKIIVKNDESTQTTTQRTNRHRSPLVRSESNNNATPASLQAKLTNSKDISENETPFKNSLKFGTRIRTSHASNKQEFVKARNCTKKGTDLDNSSKNDSEEMCQSQSTRDLLSKSHGRARVEISMRRHPSSTNRHTVPRRRRPNVNSKENKSDADVTQPKSLAGRILRRTTQTKSREVEKDQE